MSGPEDFQIKTLDLTQLEKIRDTFKDNPNELSKVFPGSIGTHEATVSVETQKEANMALLEPIAKEIMGSISPYDVVETFNITVQQHLDSIGMQAKPLTGTDIAQAIDKIITDLRSEETLYNNLVELIHTGTLTLKEGKEALSALFAFTDSANDISKRVTSWYRFQYNSYATMKVEKSKEEVLKRIGADVKNGKLEKLEAERLIRELFPENSNESAIDASKKTDEYEARKNNYQEMKELGPDTGDIQV